MTSYGAMSAAGLRVLDLLTVSEVAVRLGCSAKRVRRLAAAGELTRVDMGVLARITPESVAAYQAHYLDHIQADIQRRKDAR